MIEHQPGRMVYLRHPSSGLGIHRDPGVRLIQFFMNRAGKNLPAERKHELEKAKHILQAKLYEQRGPENAR